MRSYNVSKGVDPKLKQLKKDYAAEVDRLKKAASDLEDKTPELEILKGKINDLKENLKKDQKEYTKTISKLKLDTKRLNTQKETYIKECLSIEEFSNGLLDTKAKREERINDLKSQIEKNERSIIEQKQEANNQSKEQKKELKEIESKKELNTREVDNLAEKIKVSESIIIVLKEETKELKDDIEKLNTKKEEEQKEIENKSKKLLSLKGDLDKVQKEIAKEKEGIKQERENLSIEKDNLQKDFDKKEGRASEENQILRKENARLARDLQKIKEKNLLKTLNK